MTQLRQKMLEELQRRHYAYRTANTYIRIVRDFAAYFHRPPDKLGPEHIRQYQAYLFRSKNLSSASVSQYVSALRFLYVKTLRRHFLAEYIPFPKSPRPLPVVLSSEEAPLTNCFGQRHGRGREWHSLRDRWRLHEYCCGYGLRVPSVDQHLDDGSDNAHRPSQHRFGRKKRPDLRDRRCER